MHFTVSFANGMSLGLKSKQAGLANEHCELAFILDDNNKVDALFAEWQKKGMSIAQTPTNEDFGYTFVALDLDGNRLRVLSLGKS